MARKPKITYILKTFLLENWPKCPRWKNAAIPPSRIGLYSLKLGYGQRAAAGRAQQLAAGGMGYAEGQQAPDKRVTLLWGRGTAGGRAGVTPVTRFRPCTLSSTAGPAKLSFGSPVLCADAHAHTWSVRHISAPRGGRGSREAKRMMLFSRFGRGYPGNQDSPPAGG